MKCKYRGLSAFLLCVFCLFSCHATLAQSGSNENPIHAQAPAAQKTGLVYSNLVDKDVQTEVKGILVEGGIQPKYVDDVFSWIDQYNAGIEGLDTFVLAPSFTTTDESYVWYGANSDYYDVSCHWWKVNQYGYTDVLCRSTAFYLMRDFIGVANPIPESDWQISANDVSKSWLVTDMEGIKTNPNLTLTDQEMAQYFTLFNPVVLPQGTPEPEMYAAIKDAWNRLGVSFEAGSASLITIWTQSSAGFTAAGHAAVLIEHRDGLLLFEKTNPEYPYQATKFHTINEVKAYVINQFHSQFEHGAGILMTMRNDVLL